MVRVFKLKKCFNEYPSIQHKDDTFSAPKIPQLNTGNPSVQHTPKF